MCASAGVIWALLKGAPFFSFTIGVYKFKIKYKCIYEITAVRTNNIVFSFALTETAALTVEDVQ